jgi:hypothetical protein
MTALHAGDPALPDDLFTSSYAFRSPAPSGQREGAAGEVYDVSSYAEPTSYGATKQEK